MAFVLAKQVVEAAAEAEGFMEAEIPIVVQPLPVEMEAWVKSVFDINTLN